MTNRTTTDHEAAVSKAVAALDLPTKVSILSGQDFWSLPAVPAIGLRSLVMSDGPIGVRGTGWSPDDPSIALPSPTALAATWDVRLARRAGHVLGQEAHRKGVHLLLAPTVNLHRTPRGGRHFESYSEDPLLTGEIGAGYVTGVQDHSVGVTVKHFVANDSETERMSVDVRVSDRALRELYLAPFERIVHAGAWGVMSAYNSVNGTTMSEHGGLQRDILKTEWGFDGVIVSDWTAARSTENTALGGLDIAMPEFGNPWGERLVEAVRSGAVAEELIDDQVRRVLLLAARTGALDGVPPAVAEADRPSTVDGEAFARELAARSFVLARNSGVLPLEASRLSRVALIGVAAHDARVLGGGSAQVFPAHIVSPLDGLRAALPDGVDLTYDVGTDPQLHLRPARGERWIGGLVATFVSHDGDVLATQVLPDGSARWMGVLPKGVDQAGLATVRIRGTLLPRRDGVHTLSIRGVGMYTLTVDDEELFGEFLVPDTDDRAMIFLAPPEQRVSATLTADQPVEVSLTHQVMAPEGLPPFISFTLGHAEPSAGSDELIEEAVRAARAADVAIVVVATTQDVESEGFDRADLSLPGRQDELVARVAAANPRTVVVVNSGSPVLMPWVDDVAAVLLTWFPGQEAGAALADVLLGVAEPGGRLPTTWPRREEDCPVLAVEPTDGRLAYAEDVFIGYRAWQRTGVSPLFPFGHGMGYTTWSYDAITVAPGPGLGTATVTVTNTGQRAGREVVQVYLAPAADAARADSAGADSARADSARADSASADDRPARWLAGFAIAEAEPGESVTVEVPLPLRAAQTWADGWQTRVGRYAVQAGRSVEDRPIATVINI
jgi:beta-glucosidase